MLHGLSVASSLFLGRGDGRFLTPFQVVPAFPASAVAAEVSTAVSGDIVIAHANHPRGGTADGIKAVVPVLRRCGLKFLRLSDVAPAAASAAAPAEP